MFQHLRETSVMLLETDKCPICLRHRHNDTVSLTFIVESLWEFYILIICFYIHFIFFPIFSYHICFFLYIFRKFFSWLPIVFPTENFENCADLIKNKIAGTIASKGAHKSLEERLSIKLFCY